MKQSIWVIVVVYAAAAAALLGRTVESCEDLRTFSTDSAGICEQTRELTTASALVRYDPKAGRDATQGCDPYPYGQLYEVAIAVPLMVLRAVGTPISESTVIKFAILVLVLSGIATLYLTHRIGSRLYGAPYGLLAAVLLLGTPEFIRWSFEIHPDLLQLALIVAGFYFAVCLYERAAERWRRQTIDLGLASLCAGAAMATKYNGILLLPVIALAWNAPFLSGARGFTWRDAVRRNLGGGAVCVAMFAAGWAVCSPCFLFNSSLILEPILRATKISSAELGRSEGIIRRVFDFLHSNRTLATYIVGWAGYALVLCSLVAASASLLRRRSTELERPRILADVFVVTVLVYCLGLGQGLYNGVLLNGYARYVLPAVPIAYIAGMRIVHAIVTRWHAHRWVPIAIVLSIVIGQSLLVRAAVRQYREVYVATDTGSFRAYDWILANVPPGSKIYVDRYIRVPSQGYQVSQDFLIGGINLIRSSDYIITKSLAYDVFSNADRWERYSDSEALLAAKRLHELLELGRPSGIVKVYETSAGDVLDREDTVVVYHNLRPVR